MGVARGRWSALLLPALQLVIAKAQGAAVEAFLARLDACAAGEAAFTLALDDPAGNSYVEAGAGADAALALEHYERTPEQARGACTGVHA